MKNAAPVACLLLLLSQTSHSFAQTEGTTSTQASLSALPPVIIWLKNSHPTPDPKNCLFSHFEVLDLRPDTDRIGVHTNTGLFGRAHDCQLVFKQSAATEISDYLNTHFSRSGAPYTALIILRALWLSDASYACKDLVRDPDKRFERTHIRFKAEIYALRDNHYAPMLRFDTLQATKKMTYGASLQLPYSEWGSNLTLIVDELAGRCAVAAAKLTENKSWITLGDIRQYDAARFEAPIGSAVNFARGVYANFEEFRNNTPSIRDFEVRIENNRRILYIRDAGGSYYTRNAWGYSDGKEVYIMRDGVLCSAWREEKAFYFYRDFIRQAGSEYPANPPSGSEYPANPIYANAAVETPAAMETSPPGSETTPAATQRGDPAGRRGAYKRRYVYCIDMDTGKVY